MASYQSTRFGNVARRPFLRLGGSTKHRLKLLVFVAALVAWCIAIGTAPNKHHAARSVAHSPTQMALESETILRESYAELNEELFHNRLPQDTILDWSNVTDMAITEQHKDGQFHIMFNPKYALAYRVMRLTMIHEQCHIKVWHTYERPTLEDVATSQHGPTWRACMLQVELQGGFRRELIDFYRGD